MKIRIAYLFLLSILVVFCVGTSHAQLEFLDDYDDQYLNYNEGPGAKRKFKNDADSRYSSHIYEAPTVRALSHLFWAVNLYKLDDDEAIDEFMRINECDIYKNFSTDEFEWVDIRDATRDFIRDNKADFPTRFEFLIPLKLLEYDGRRKAFEIQDEYKINAIRRFEVYALDFRTEPCVMDRLLQDGYPRSLILEFSRPFSLTHVPMPETVAEEYIKKSMVRLKKYDDRLRTKARMYTLRDAYLIIKVKMFTHGRFLGLNTYKIPVVQMMGVLEGYELYEDRHKKKLFYAENYVANKNKKADVKLQDEYNILLQRSKDRGMLHYP